MNSNRISAVLMAAVVVASVTGVTLLATPAAAQTDGDSLLGDVVGEDAPSFMDDPKGWAKTALSAGDAASERFGYWARSKTPSFVSETFPALGNEKTAQGEADAVQSYWNKRNATLLEWANTRKNWSENNTVELVWSLEGETATKYLEVNATNGNLTRAEIVTSTDRTVDHDVELCGYAAASSRQEIERFVEEIAEPDKNVTAADRARLGTKYSGHVETSLYPSEGDCRGDS